MRVVLPSESPLTSHARNAGYDDNLAAAALLHVGVGRLARVECALGVHSKNAVPICLAELLGRLQLAENACAEVQQRAWPPAEARACCEPAISLRWQC